MQPGDPLEKSCIHVWLKGSVLLDSVEAPTNPKVVVSWVLDIVTAATEI